MGHRWQIVTFVSQHSSAEVLNWYAEHLSGWSVDVSNGVVIPEGAAFSDAERWSVPYIRVTDVEGGEWRPAGIPCRSQAVFVYRASSTPVTTHSLEAYRQYSVARDLQREGNRRQSVEQLRDALTLDPEFAMAWRMLAANLLALRDYAEAEEALQHALRLRDQVSETERLHIDGYSANRRGDSEAALTAYERIVDLSPRDAVAHFNRAVSLRLLGRDAESLEAYDPVIELDPQHRLAHSNRADALRRLGRHRESFESFKRGTFRHTLERYLFFAPYKALALARDSTGAWAYGYSSRQSSAPQAVERAMDGCATQANRFRVQLNCRLFAVGNDVVWGDDPYGKDAPTGVDTLESRPGQLSRFYLPSDSVSRGASRSGRQSAYIQGLTLCTSWCRCSPVSWTQRGSGWRLDRSFVSPFLLSSSVTVSGCTTGSA